MNHLHRDGRALLTLTRKVVSAADKDLSWSKSDEANPAKKIPDSKPAPPDSVQRQDTDYDVKPAIPKSKAPDGARQAHTLDTGMSVHATQMGESEGQGDRDARQFHARM